VDLRKNYKAYVAPFGNLREDITRCLEFIGWENTIKRGSTVFIKPNFTYPYYKPGVTTNPKFLEQLLVLLKERTSNIIIGESDGANRAFTADAAFKGHGLDKICSDLDITLVNLSSEPARRVEDLIQGKKVAVYLPELLLDDIDCFISVPVLKVHAMTYATLSMKNLWGCYPDPMRCLHHKNLSEKLTLITKHLNPKLVLIDGTFSLNSHGPMYGEPIRTNLILGANNPVVADTLGTKVLGVPLSKVEHILTAEREGLGTCNLDKVLLNQDWSKFCLNFKVQRTLVDRCSLLLFHSELLSKLVMDSSLRPIIYRAVSFVRNSEERSVVTDLKKSANFGKEGSN